MKTTSAFKLDVAKTETGPSHVLFENEQRILSFFDGASERDWLSWSWQARHRMKSLEAIERFVRLTDDEIAGISSTGSKLTMAVPPYFASLMDPDDPNCPIRRQCIPTSKELTISPEEMRDPCGEEKYSPVHGLVHRYPDRVLFLVSEMCPMYCRHCTRSRFVGEGRRTVNSATYDEAIHYIRTHPEVRDVLISGGDPLMLSDHLLEYIIQSVRSIPHVELIRIGTRVPVTLPQRVTPDLVRMLKKNGPLWMSVHFNHSKEISPRVVKACSDLADAGIPLGSQTVLLKGVNDNPETMKRLMHDLVKIRVRPYYIYQCDPIVGSRHFRTPIATGLKIMEALRGHTSGYAVPTFVIDAPGGGGKIPVEPNYIVSHQDGKYVLRNYAGEEFEYLDNAE